MKVLSRSDFLGILTNSSLANAAYIEKNLPPGSDNISPATGSRGIQPYTGEWGQQQVMHLIRRALFGVTHDDVAFFSALTLNQALDMLLRQSADPHPPVNAYNDNSHTDTDVPFGETWVSSRPTNEKDKGETDHRRLRSLKGWWIGLMLNQDRSLTEKMTLFWHNHIAGAFEYMRDARPNYGYIFPLRHHSLGNFKKMMLDITVCPGMLQYLNGNESTKAAPNENYSRELQELFTVGKGQGSHYTQGDVQAAARVLTGWTTPVDDITTIFKPENHDTGDKQFSAFYNNTVIRGKAGAAGAEEVAGLIDMIFATREVAMHTCRCLYRWFVYPAIDGSIETGLIEPMADILIASNYDIAPALRALLGSEHFFDPIHIGRQIKNPVDHVIGLCRQFDVTSYPNDIARQYKAWYALSGMLSSQSMCPGDPPNVAGWPAYYLPPSYDRAWINSDTLVARNMFTDMAVSGNTITDNYGEIRLNFDLLAYTGRCPDPLDAAQLITDSTALLCPVAFDDTQKALLKNMLDPPQIEGPPWRQAWAGYMADPGNQAKKEIVTGRLRPYYTYILQRGECQLG
jgi:uncharacterized protein (DUF1800 family)